MPTRQAARHKVIQRGDVTVEIGENGLAVPNIVKSYQYGGTTVHISDNFMAKTDEEKERVDERVRNALMTIYQSVLG